jgi:hypothetical protein
VVVSLVSIITFGIQKCEERITLIKKVRNTHAVIKEVRTRMGNTN